MNEKATKLVGSVAEHRVYLATVTPPIAKELFFVSTYDSADPLSNAVDHHGYQRPPTPKRFAEIAKYFAEGNNRFKITPLTLSIRLSEIPDIEKFIYLLDAGDIQGIKTAFGDNVASVVDGQHRLNGLLHAWTNDADFMPPIPCMMYFGLNFVEEAELFNTVNVTQRKLPKALIETTKGDITEANEATYHQQIRRIAFSLCREDDSVWGPIDGVEQINMTGVRDPNRPVTYEGLRRSTSNMFPKQLLDRLTSIDEDLPLKLAKRYWEAVASTCAAAWKGIPATRVETDPVTGAEHEVKIKYRIKDLVGVASLAKLGKDVITSQLEADAKTANRLETLVDALGDVDWEKQPDNPWMRSQAGFAGQKELYELLYALVYQHSAPEGVELTTVDDEEDDESEAA